MPSSADVDLDMRLKDNGVSNSCKYFGAQFVTHLKTNTAILKSMRLRIGNQFKVFSACDELSDYFKPKTNFAAQFCTFCRKFWLLNPSFTSFLQNLEFNSQTFFLEIGGAHPTYPYSYALIPTCPWFYVSRVRTMCPRVLNVPSSVSRVLCGPTGNE